MSELQIPIHHLIKETVRRRIKAIHQTVKEHIVSRWISMPPNIEKRRRELVKSQILFPPDQKYSGILRLRIYGGGLKDKLYVYLATSIAHCIERNLFLDWDGDLEGYGKWDDWFEPFIGKRPEHPLPVTNLVPDWYEMDPLFIQILNRYPPTFIRNIWKLNEATIDSFA